MEIYYEMETYLSGRILINKIKKPINVNHNRLFLLHKDKLF